MASIGHVAIGLAAGRFYTAPQGLRGPIGMRFFSPRGLRVAAVEAVYFLPLVLYALWPRRRSSGLIEP
jgi:hypothetical protein